VRVVLYLYIPGGPHLINTQPMHLPAARNNEKKVPITNNKVYAQSFFFSWFQTSYFISLLYPLQIVLLCYPFHGVNTRYCQHTKCSLKGWLYRNKSWHRI